jgi:hypothetical protein
MKMKARRKKLQRRIKDYEATIKRLGANKSKGYRQPGSYK